MTPERQKWWDNLPKREKILRKELSHLKYQRSKEKERMSIEQNGTSKKFILERINCYTLFIHAIRRELAAEILWKEIEAAKANAKFVGFYETHEGDKIFPEILECERCGEKFLELYGEYEYCPRCGCLIDPY